MGKTIFLIILFCFMSIVFAEQNRSEPNDVATLKSEVKQLKEELAEYKHKIQVAKRTISKLEQEESKIRLHIAKI